MIELIKRLVRRFRFRSSVTGRYVTPEYAKSHPAETVKERVYESR